eukprot:UC1_evm2s1127
MLPFTVLLFAVLTVDPAEGGPRQQRLRRFLPPPLPTTTTTGTRTTLSPGVPVLPTDHSANILSTHYDQPQRGLFRGADGTTFDGHYIAYRELTRTTAGEAALSCWQDFHCISFQYSSLFGRAELNRIDARCIEAIDGQFLQQSSLAAAYTLYQMRVSYQRVTDRYIEDCQVLPRIDAEWILPPVDDPVDAFEKTSNAAVNMAGSNYFVNFRELKQVTLKAVAQSCLSDATCLSFDFSMRSGDGWLHRLLPECAASAGARYIVDTTNTDYYTKLELYRNPEISTNCTAVAAASAEEEGPGIDWTLLATVVGAVAGAVGLLIVVVFIVQRRSARREAHRLQMFAAQQPPRPRRRVPAAAVPQPRQPPMHHNVDGEEEPPVMGQRQIYNNPAVAAPPPPPAPPVE